MITSPNLPGHRMTETSPGCRDPGGIILCRSVLDYPQLAAWALRIDAQYQALNEARQSEDAAAANLLVIAASERYVPTASSFTIGVVLSDEDLSALFSEINAKTAGAWIRDQLRNRVVCDLDQTWVRRQYAPKHYPPLHAPHGWHQDGALKFDFRSFPYGNFPSDALLPIVTCWIALDPCGAEAPGLELVTRRLDGLLAPAELTDESVRTRFTSQEFWCPVMEPGDALLFRGDILHRTHVTAAMTKDRTSIELRFFPANDLPPRLHEDRFTPF